MPERAATNAPPRQFRVPLAALLLSYLAVYLLLGWATRVTDSGPAMVDIAYLPFRTAATVLLFAAARATTTPTIAHGWRLLAIAQAFAVLGNLTWVYSDFAGSEPGNWLYLAWAAPYNALSIAGLWMMIRTRGPRPAGASDWIDAGILMLAASVIAWYFVAARIIPQETSTFESGALFFLDQASSITVTLLAVAVWLRAPGGLSRHAAQLLWVAYGTLAVTDLVFEDQILDATYRNGSILDAAYALAVSLIAIAADTQRRAPAGDPPGDPDRVDRGDLLVLGATAAALIPLTVEILRSDFGSHPMAVLSLGVVMLMLLVLWRQRLARREIGHLMAGRLRLEHQLWHAQKIDAIGQLAGGIAHDFNNVLAVISSHAQLVRSGASADPRAELAEIEFATERAAVLVRRLLTFSSVGSPARQAVVLSDVVASMQQMLRQLLVSGISIEFRIGDDAATVALADGQLEQILLNLTVNARDATNPGGSVIVRTARATVLSRDDLNRRGVAPGLWALLEVSDTGHGMDDATRDRLFEPFFTTKSHTGGTGLGLATVAGIVQAADGHVVVDSAVGVGTTMRVFLPLSAALPAAPGRTSEVSVHHDAAATILIVDDELPIRTALARYMSRLGYLVIEAADVAQGVSALDQAQWAVDLVLTDVRMPDQTGIEIAARVRERRPNVPVIFMSGQSGAPVRTGRAPVFPRADTIDKPFDLEVVAERIRTKLAEARALH